MVGLINKLFAGFVGIMGAIVFIMSFFKLGLIGLGFYTVFIVSLLCGLVLWGVSALIYKIYKIFSKDQLTH